MLHTDVVILSAQQELDTLADTIRTADQGVAHAVGNMVEHALTAGDALLRAKAKVGHGNWLRYLKDKCDLGEDRAERYMRLAHGREVLTANSARLRNLSITQALKLIAGNKPKAQPRGSDGCKAPKPAKAAERLTSLAWSNASPADRTKFLNAVGVDAILAAAPSSWDLQAHMLRAAPLEELALEVARKTPTRIQQEQMAADYAQAHAEKRNSGVSRLGRGHRHAGVTLEHEPVTTTTITEETTTKH
jgi:hypothetical protein